MQNLALGITAGVCSKLCNYPLLNFKNTVQQGKPISFKPNIVYRGLPMACMNLGGTTGVQFVTTGFFQTMIAGERKMTQQDEVLAALLGGLVSGVPCSVWELTMIQQQNFGGTLIGTPKRLIAEAGPMSLLRGVITTCARESIFTCAMLGVTPVLQRDLQVRFSLGNEQALAIGALTGAFISATVTHPLDTIKTRMQGNIKGGNIRQEAALVRDEFGYIGMFKGLGFRIALIATTFFLVNKFKEAIVPVMFPVPEEEKGKVQ